MTDKSLFLVLLQIYCFEHISVSNRLKKNLKNVELHFLKGEYPFSNTILISALPSRQATTPINSDFSLLTQHLK